MERVDIPSTHPYKRQMVTRSQKVIVKPNPEHALIGMYSSMNESKWLRDALNSLDG